MSTKEVPQHLKYQTSLARKSFGRYVSPITVIIIKTNSSMISQTGGSYLNSSDQGRSRAEINNLGQEHDDRLYLEKANFDHKLKLSCRENSEGRESSGVGMTEDVIDSFPYIASSQTTGSFNELRQKSLQLEQRNQLLVRAKLAIVALKKELEKLRVDSKKHSYDLEEQLLHSRLKNDEFMYKHHESALAFESEMCKANDLVAEQEYLRASAEEKLVSHNLLNLYVMICNDRRSHGAVMYMLSPRIFIHMGPISI